MFASLFPLIDVTRRDDCVSFMVKGHTVNLPQQPSGSTQFCSNFGEPGACSVNVMVALGDFSRLSLW